MAKSIEEMRKRMRGMPRLNYNTSLPIYAKADEIIQAIRRNRVTVISGETGCGKTTQIPRFCLDAGQGTRGTVGCTQPRRIAAITVAGRIAEEMGEEIGRSVGYKIRFQDRTSRHGCIKIMTDGILLAEAQRNPSLREYDTLIIDEAHERSLNIDFLLGIVKKLLGKRRDLKLIITSATIDTEKFSRAFGGAPVVEVSGRLYPVEVRYLDDETTEGEVVEFVEKALRALEEVVRDPTGDVLIFMPTEESILETCEAVRGRKYKSTTVLPLFARLAASDQKKVFASYPGRKIVVATNIAETSLTIPGIKYVIDTGLARVPRYSPRSRITSLPVVPVSRSSADQRKGRCGRVRDGVCFRLYSETDYASRPLYTQPEIRRANLAEVILRMLARQLGDIGDFPFMDPPDKRSIRDGFDVLIELGAIRKEKAGAGEKGRSYSLTERGRLMSELPLDPTLSRMLIEASRERCFEEVLTLVSALSIQDPRERPVEHAELADQRQAVFKDPASDFMTLLNLWGSYLRSTQNGRRLNLVGKFCKEHYLSFKRMREWGDIREQLATEWRESRLSARITPRKPRDWSRERYPAEYCRIHRSLLSGYLSNIALKKEKNFFRGTKGREIMIFPGSTLFNRAGEWIMCAETVKTTRLYARIVAGIEPHWIEEAGGILCRRSISDPRWDRARGEVTATEKVSLFGLPIIPGRPVAYGTVNPQEAGELFVHDALVLGDTDASYEFLEHNRRLREDVIQIENRVRRKGYLAGEDKIAAFYRERLPGVYDIGTLENAIRMKGGDGFLKMEPEYLLREAPESEMPALYPTSISIEGRDFDCEYVFQPGSPDDGLTLLLPAEIASLVPSDSLDWLVPGYYREKIAALIKGLPKAFRRKLVPAAETVDHICKEMPRGRGNLFVALSDFLARHYGADIPPSEIADVSLPNHLRMRISLRDEHGREIRAGRHLRSLLQSSRREITSDSLSRVREKWEKTGITAWDFGDLPAAVSIPGEGHDGWAAYPALSEEGHGISLRLHLDRNQALSIHRRGVAALYEKHFSKHMSSLRRDIVPAADLRKAALGFGGEDQLLERLWSRAIRELFAVDIRNRREFSAFAEEMGPRLYAKAEELLKTASALLAAYAEARDAINGLKDRARGIVPAERFLDARSAELDLLLPKDFVSRYPPDRWPHIQRYAKALMIRAQRGYAHPAKDRSKEQETRRLRRLWEQQLQRLPSSASAEKKAALQDLRWMLEECKVAVFAPELKTAGKVSPGRFMKRLDEISAMP